MRLRLIIAFLFALTLNSALLAETYTARTAFIKGYTLLEEGRYYPAIEHFKITIADTSYPLLDYGYYYIARAYQESRNFEYAIQVYNIVNKFFPDSIFIPQATFHLAECQSSLKEYPQALATYKSFIAKFPDHELIPEARFNLGDALGKSGDYAAAAKTYRRIEQLHPGSIYSEKALERADQLAQENLLPTDMSPSTIVYKLGMKYFDDSNYARSNQCFIRLCRLFPDSSLFDDALIMQGRVALRQNKIRQAIACFKKAANLDKDSKPEALYYLARSYDYLDRKKEAVALLEKLVLLFPKSKIADEAEYYIGYFYAQLGEKEKAIEAYAALIANYPHSAYYSQVLWAIGKIYYAQGNFTAAYENLKTASSLSEGKASDQSFFWLAKCAEKIGNTLEAIKAYQAAVTRFDHSYYAYRARETLQKYNIALSATVIPQIKEDFSALLEIPADAKKHENKFLELVALGMADEAAGEASLLIKQVPKEKQNQAEFAKYHAYIFSGKYAKPIQFAEKKINDAAQAGAIASLDPHVRRLSYPRGYWQYVEKYALMYDLDPYLVYAVIREESRFRPQALSHARAHGLMQIMPSTGRKIARDLDIRYAGWKMYQPHVNIEMGTYYLSRMIKRFDGSIPLALAGYNGGPARVEKWLRQTERFDLDEFIENIPLSETRNYVKKVMKSYYGYKRTYAAR
jgi:soluble lytic murein transglycosylase-like protein/predicted negative regulator of RcsB-dependent stress response